MVSVWAHEFTEAVTDPLGTSWYMTAPGPTLGYENADMCNFNFGSSLPYSSGGYLNNANIMLTTPLGTKYYLVQQNWNLQTRQCAMSP